jgi:hypothetical protein
MHDAPLSLPASRRGTHHGADAIVIAAMRGEPARNLDLSRQSYRLPPFCFCRSAGMGRSPPRTAPGNGKLQLTPC